MARMWPETVPSWVSADSRRWAEIEVYECLRDTLCDGWEVFYSRPWWGINPKGGETDGEADFILAHPDKGFLFLEVKGGRIEYDSSSSRWTSRDRNGIVFNIKDPMKQALACKHQYIDRLRKVPGWPNSYIRFRHGVVFPDSSEKGNAVNTIGGYERSLFCLSERFERDFGSWIEERLSAHSPVGQKVECAPGPAAVALLRRLVADPVRLHVPLRRILQTENMQLEELATGQQLHLITLLESIKKAVIEGGAGTGKTLLAMEMAIRLAASGLKVCLICFNSPIAEWIKERLAGSSGVTVGTFHSICGKLVRDAGIRCHVSGRIFYDTELPSLALEVLEKMGGSVWEAVLVDEGQDFLDHWWQVIEHMLPRDGSGIIRVFCDPNQLLYRNPVDIASIIGAQIFTLKHNLRNTKAISKVTDFLYKGPQIFAMGPDGEAPVLFPFDHTESWVGAIKLVVKLIKEESISHGDIAVLLSGENDAAKFRSELSMLQIMSSDAEKLDLNTVIVDSIKRFKGLESLVVILVMNRNMANEPELAYVAVSRAKTRLYVFGNILGTALDNALREAALV